MEGKRLQSKVISTSSPPPATTAAAIANNNDTTTAVAPDQSPERSRRKSKWATERQAPGDMDERLVEAQNGKQRRRLQDPLPLEDAATAADQSADRLSKRIKSDVQANSNSVLPVRVMNPEYVPRSGYFFEHDDRSARRPRPNFRWRSGEGRQSGGNWRRDDRWQGGGSESFEKKPENRWHHDGFAELQAEEIKKESGQEWPKNEHILPDNEANRAGRKAEEYVEGNASDVKGKDGKRKASEREEGDAPHSRTETRDMEGRSNIPRVWERGNWRNYEQDRSALRGGRGRRYGARVNDRWAGGTGRDIEVRFHDRWKHDLYDEANRSPTPKQEEDPIAKVEALLAT